MKKMSILSVLLLMLAAREGLAYTEEEKLRCGGDAERLCSGSAGESCLAARENSLSSACRTYLREKQESHSRPPPPAAPPVTAQTSEAAPAVPQVPAPLSPERARETGPCAQDVERLCTGAEQDRIGMCLKNNFDRVSPECRQKIKQRLAGEADKREWPRRELRP